MPKSIKQLVQAYPFVLNISQILITLQTQYVEKPMARHDDRQYKLCSANGNSVKMVTFSSVGIISQSTNLKTALARSQNSIKNLVSTPSARTFINVVSALKCVLIASSCSRWIFLHHYFNLCGALMTMLIFGMLGLISI